MNKIEKIRTEIERLKNNSELAKMEWINEGYNQNAFAEDCRIGSFNTLLSFLDTLEEEPEMNLERDAVQFCFDKGLNVTPYQAKTIASHFYELGKNSK